MVNVFGSLKSRTSALSEQRKLKTQSRQNLQNLAAPSLGDLSITQQKGWSTQQIKNKTICLWFLKKDIP